MRFLAFVTHLFLPIALTQALKFELYAQPQAELTPRCIRNFVGADTLVVVTAIVSGNKGDGQRVNIDVCPMGYSESILTDRFVILRAMITVVQGMLPGKPEWRLLRMVKRKSMSVSRTSLVMVLYPQIRTDEKVVESVHFAQWSWMLILGVLLLTTLPFKKLRYSTILSVIPFLTVEIETY
jgi:hypothetical protein